jgi:hypothetical protein
VRNSYHGSGNKNYGQQQNYQQQNYQSSSNQWQREPEKKETWGESKGWGKQNLLEDGRNQN